jgi:hypothetical protein
MGWALGHEILTILTDQKHLSVLVRSAKDQEVRLAALDKLTDQALLEDLANNVDDKMVREIAIKILKSAQQSPPPYSSPAAGSESGEA